MTIIEIITNSPQMTEIGKDYIDFLEKYGIDANYEPTCLTSSEQLEKQIWFISQRPPNTSHYMIVCLPNEYGMKQTTPQKICCGEMFPINLDGVENLTPLGAILLVNDSTGIDDIFVWNGELLSSQTFQYRYNIIKQWFKNFSHYQPLSAAKFDTDLLIICNEPGNKPILLPISNIVRGDFYVEKTESPDVYKIYKSDNSALGLASIRKLDVSKALRVAFSTNTATVPVDAKFNNAFNKWEVTAVTAAII